MGFMPDIEEFRAAMRVVEGKSVPGLRSLEENKALGIVPMQPLTPGAVTGSLASEVTLEIPECMSDFSDEEIHELLKAAEGKGVGADEVFQTAEDKGLEAVQELLGESAVTGAIIGGALGGAPGAAVGGAIGALAKKRADRKAAERLRITPQEFKNREAAARRARLRKSVAYRAGKAMSKKALKKSLTRAGAGAQNMRKKLAATRKKDSTPKQRPQTRPDSRAGKRPQTRPALPMKRPQTRPAPEKKAAPKKKIAPKKKTAAKKTAAKKTAAKKTRKERVSAVKKKVSKKAAEKTAAVAKKAAKKTPKKKVAKKKTPKKKVAKKKTTKKAASK